MLLIMFARILYAHQKNNAIFFQLVVSFETEFSLVPSVRKLVFIEDKYLVGEEIVRVRIEEYWLSR